MARRRRRVSVVGPLPQTFILIAQDVTSLWRFADGWTRPWPMARPPTSPYWTLRSGPDAGVSAVHAASEVRRQDLKACGGEHGFEQPPEGAELGPNVRREVLARIPTRGVLGRTIEPAVDNGLGLCRLEVEDQVMQAKDATGSEKPRGPYQRDCLPEVRQVMQGIAGEDSVRGWTRVLVGEKAGL